MSSDNRSQFMSWLRTRPVGSCANGGSLKQTLRLHFLLRRARPCSMQALHCHSSPLTRHQNILTSGSQCSTSCSPSRPLCSTSRRGAASRLAAQAAAVHEAPQQQKLKWTYKYKRMPSPSPCKPGEQLCCEVEALVQNVLSSGMPPPP